MLVFRKFLCSNLFVFLLTSVPTSNFPYNHFSPELSYPFLAYQYQHPITDLSFLVITHSPPNEPTYLASTSHIPSSDLNILTTSVVNEHRI